MQLRKCIHTLCYSQFSGSTFQCVIKHIYITLVHLRWKTVTISLQKLSIEYPPFVKIVQRTIATMQIVLRMEVITLLIVYRVNIMSYEIVM